MALAVELARNRLRSSSNRLSDCILCNVHFPVDGQEFWAADMTDRQQILLCICVEIFGFGVLCALSAAAYVRGQVGVSVLGACDSGMLLLVGI